MENLKVDKSCRFRKNCKILQNFKRFQLDNLVDFEKCCKTRICLQRSAPIQPKTSEILPKFCQKLAIVPSRQAEEALDLLEAERDALREEVDELREHFEADKVPAA